MLHNIFRWLFGWTYQTKVRNLSQYADKKIPWWCMDVQHQPYFNEGAYDTHMLEIHKTDVRRSYKNKVRTETRT